VRRRCRQDNDPSPASPRLSPRRKKKCHLHTPTSPRIKRRRVARVGDASDEREQEDSDDEVVIANYSAYRRPSRSRSHKPRRASQQHRAHSPRCQLARRPLAPARPEITIPTCAQSSAGGKPKYNRRNSRRSGGAAGALAHGLLATTIPAAVEPTPHGQRRLHHYHNCHFH
jgi:hypothetical protein